MVKKIKRKGAYEYEIGWHQDSSALIIQKAVEAHLVKGVEIDWFIRSHQEVNDFMLRTNVPRSSRLMIEYPGNDIQTLQNTTRYYMSDKGGYLYKIMPPLPKFKTVEQMRVAARTPGQIKKFNIWLAEREKFGVYEGERISRIEEGHKAVPMNTMGELRDINYQWYINEARKLVDPLWRGAYNYLLT